MTRRWNLSLWVGFLVILAGLFTFVPVFVRFPATRDFPWPTLLMLCVGLGMMAMGLRRAFAEPQVYRGRVLGSVLGALGVALVGLFGYGVFYAPRQLPDSAGSPRVGQEAPDFTLPDKNGNLVTLSRLLETGPGGAGKANGVVLIFYRGYW